MMSNNFNNVNMNHYTSTGTNSSMLAPFPLSPLNRPPSQHQVGFNNMPISPAPMISPPTSAYMGAGASMTNGFSGLSNMSGGFNQPATTGGFGMGVPANGMGSPFPLSATSPYSTFSQASPGIPSANASYFPQMQQPQQQQQQQQVSTPQQSGVGLGVQYTGMNGGGMQSPVGPQYGMNGMNMAMGHSMLPPGWGGR